MNGPSHWRKAEEHLGKADAIDTDGDQDGMSAWHQRQAQAHATMALTAATLTGNLILLHPEERAAWDHATGHPEDDPEVTR